MVAKAKPAAKSASKPAAKAGTKTAAEVRQETIKEAEVIEGTAVAVVNKGFSGFKVARRVTMPTLNPVVNTPYALKIVDAFRESTYVDPDPKKRNEKPATICSVIDMNTGAVYLWLVGDVCVKNLKENYPDDDYVGRIFGVQKLPKRPSKRYHDWEIIELEADE